MEATADSVAGLAISHCDQLAADTRRRAAAKAADQRSGLRRLDLAQAVFGFHAIAYLWLTVSPGDLAATGEALSLHPETSFAAAVYAR